jgi:hypothetical protein
LEHRLQAFEQAVRDGGAGDVALDEVDKALAVLVDAIGELDPSTPADAANGPFNAAEVAARIDAMADALHDGNFKAVQLLEPLAEALTGHCEQTFAELSQSVRAFDFGAAQHALTALSGSVYTCSGESTDG